NYMLTKPGQVKAISVVDFLGAPELFAVGLDGQVYEQKFDAQGTSVSSYVLTQPGQVQSISVGVFRTDNIFYTELFALGLDNQVYGQRFDGNGNSTGPYFLTQPGQVKSFSLGSVALPTLFIPIYVPEVFAVGLDDQVYAQKFGSNGLSAGGYFL